MNSAFNTFESWKNVSRNVITHNTENMRKSCVNDRTITKIMIIREELYSKDVM
jgi:hypothetical protein